MKDYVPQEDALKSQNLDCNSSDEENEGVLLKKRNLVMDMDEFDKSQNEAGKMIQQHYPKPKEEDENDDDPPF